MVYRVILSKVEHKSTRQEVQLRAKARTIKAFHKTIKTGPMHQQQGKTERK